MAAGDTAEYFYANVEINPNTAGCWLWGAATSKQGYGIVRTSRGMGRAHRVSWELTNGTIPNGLLVLHKCDVRRCVRPDHLFLGTHADNVRDCIAKDRAPHGERHGCARLSKDEVLAIRSSADSGLDLAARFNISKTNVSAIKTRRIWQRV